MTIIWDEEKNEKLKRERGISFEEIAILILEQKYIRVIKHQTRLRQRMFLIPIHGYVHAVPFVSDEEGNIVLKTVFPSRKFNRMYGGKIGESKT